MLAAYHIQAPTEVAAVTEIQDALDAALRDDQRFQEELRAKERTIDAKFAAEIERTIVPATLDGWLAALQDPEWETRLAAVRLLGRLGAQTPVTRLCALLEDDTEHGGVRIEAAEILATLGGQVALDARVVDALFYQVAHTRDDPQFAAREALATLAPWVSRDALIAHVGDTHWAAREAALEALIALGSDAPTDVLVAAVGDVWEHARETALRALQEQWQIRPGAVTPVVDALVKEARGILEEGRPAGPMLGALVATLQADDIGRRRLSTPDALAELTVLSQHASWRVRWAAVEALSQVTAAWTPAVRARLQALHQDAQSAGVREAAQAALAASG